VENVIMSQVEYVLGHSWAEMRRLVLQASILRPITERLLREAGIEPGMRVLDIGSGMGDVALLAAELIGPKGMVVGMDRNADALASARERVSDSGHANIRFHHGALEEFSDPLPFDLVIGRYVLLHQPDPGAFVSLAAERVKPGGSIAFHEGSFATVYDIFPSIELQQQCLDWIHAAFSAAGASLDVAFHMGQYLKAIGKGEPSLHYEIPVGSDWESPIVAWLPSTVRSLLPQLEKTGNATAQEVEVETLEDRLRNGLRGANIQVVGPAQMCGWVRL
jgi:ubiquinone/menaquinone biosynthesis C-methylase UbiE